MPLTIQQWHKHYQQQAKWTKNLRQYIYKRTQIYSAARILEVGCGTGVILNELNHLLAGNVFGVDIDVLPLNVAKSEITDYILTIGDALALPYLTGAFDISLCHFLLLWVNNPLQVLQEMARVTRIGGYVLALAEPDYGGRIDYPTELAQVGQWQTEALRKQGADTSIGRKLRAFFSRTNLRNIEVGVLGGEWRGGYSSEEFDLEWDMLRADLGDNDDFLLISTDLKNLDQIYHDSGQRILYVPTFYAIGEVMA